MELIQIVPVLPPALSGVGDYATLLAGELQAAGGVRTRFVVGDPGWTGPASAADAPFPARAVTARTAAALLHALDEAEAAGGAAGVALLHYVGYGYAHRGCPFWLVDAAERWRGARPGRRLIVLFHELYATGPVWSSVFWTSPFQRWLAARLGRAADFRRMTTGEAARQLRPMLRRGHDALETIPVFSTLGEPAAPPPLSARRRRMVVFGSRSWRVDVYTRRAADFAAACHALGIEHVVDVGSPTGLALAGGGFAPVPVEEAGPLPSAEAGTLFADSLAGYFSYPVPYLGKSTIFAAYCAHGMVPVTHPANRAPSPDGLQPGEHYLAGTGDGAGTLAAEQLANVAQGAFAWYSAHRLAVHAAGVRTQMTTGSQPCEGI